MWLLVPGARNPIPSRANQRLVGGASMGDLARIRFAEDYDASVRTQPEEVGGRSCRVFDLTAKAPGTPYPKVDALARREGPHALQSRLLSSASGKPAKEVLFTRFGRSQGRTTVAEMEVHDLLAPESRRLTQLEYTEYRPAKIEDEMFTPEGAAKM